MISCIRKGDITHQKYTQYLQQIEANQNYLRKSVFRSSTSPSVLIAR